MAGIGMPTDCNACSEHNEVLTHTKIHSTIE